MGAMLSVPFVTYLTGLEPARSYDVYCASGTGSLSKLLRVLTASAGNTLTIAALPISNERVFQVQLESKKEGNARCIIVEAGQQLSSAQILEGNDTNGMPAIGVSEVKHLDC